MPRTDYVVPADKQHLIPRLEDGWRGLFGFGGVYNSYRFKIQGQFMGGGVISGKMRATKEAAQQELDQERIARNAFRAWYKVDGAIVTVVHRLYLEPEYHMQFDITDLFIATNWLWCPAAHTRDGRAYA